GGPAGWPLSARGPAHTAVARRQPRLDCPVLARPPAPLRSAPWRRGNLPAQPPARRLRAEPSPAAVVVPRRPGPGFVQSIVGLRFESLRGARSAATQRQSEARSRLRAHPERDEVRLVYCRAPDVGV